MTGATGFIGSYLGGELVKAGHTLVLVTRNCNKAEAALGFKAQLIECDLSTTPLSAENFKGIDVIINLAGESIDGRWTLSKKNKILSSRILSVRNLLANCPASVRTIVTASAQGIYGDRGDEQLDESSTLGEGFLADVCKAWESEFSNCRQRLVILRLGMVISDQGGALKKLISLFKKNLGAVLGKGNQWISYISLNDLTQIFIEALQNEKYNGIINAVTNNPLTNKEFTKILCKKLDVWCLPPVPSIVLRIALGEMSQLVLCSLKLAPSKLNELGYKFQDTDFEAALCRGIRQ